MLLCYIRCISYAYNWRNYSSLSIHIFNYCKMPLKEVVWAFENGVAGAQTKRSSSSLFNLESWVFLQCRSKNRSFIELSVWMGGSSLQGLTEMKQIGSNKDIFITSKRGALSSKIWCGTSQKNPKIMFWCFSNRLWDVYEIRSALHWFWLVRNSLNVSSC